jgi:hypothetical protein
MLSGEPSVYLKLYERLLLLLSLEKLQQIIHNRTEETKKEMYKCDNRADSVIGLLFEKFSYYRNIT